MPEASTWLAFAGTALLMALSPGPNMIYLLSRTLCQGRRAGVLSWLGVVLGFGVHMVCAVLGLTALFLAVPMGYELLKGAGAAYLLWLAWLALRPGARSPLERQELLPEGPRRLFIMGLLTSSLNPKVALLYLSALPQFVDPMAGSVMTQSLILGATQVLIGSSVNLLIALSAAGMAHYFAHKPLWLRVQRYLMGVVLGTLALRLATLQRHAS